MDETRRVIEMASARNDGLLTKLMSKLARNESGAILPTLNNAMLILAGDPLLRGLLGFDEFRSEYLLLRAPPVLEDGAALMAGPYPRSWQTEDLALIQGYVQRQFSPRFQRQTIEDAVIVQAASNPFHTIRAWLDGLSWDGTRRLDTWLTKAFGTPPSEYAETTGSKWLIAAVRRIRSPGCKFDYMLILEGEQGIGKSSAIQALFGQDGYSDSLPAALESKDAAIGLLGVWVLELAEIEQVVRAELEVIKAFLSRSVDRYRPPYGRSYVARPRQGVLVGTTNGTDYLRDASGNRRFWPNACKFADIPWILDNREQLWAEAAAREAMGESIWLDAIEVQETAASMQDQRMEEDLWVAPIETYLSDRLLAEVSAGMMLSLALGIPLERQDQRQKRRVAAILKRAGWVQSELARSGKSRVRMWTRAT